ncbi:MAG: hypothetical protein AAGC55_29985, partial [Myxococcota bacterium]
GRVLGAGAAAIYAARSGMLTRVAIADGELRPTAFVNWDGDQHQSLAVGADHSVLYLDRGGVSRADRDGATVHYQPVDVGAAIHVAAGPDDGQLWLADTRGRVHLAELSGPGGGTATSKAQVAAPGSVFHMVGAGTGVALVAVDASADGTVEAWSVAVIGTAASGDLEVRWKHPIAAPDSRERSDLFVAASADAVALGGSAAVQVWSSGGKSLFHAPQDGR